MVPAVVQEDPTNGRRAGIDSKSMRTGFDVPERPLPRSHEEYQYLDLIREILDRGEHRPDRTGTGTYSIFAPPQLRFALSRSTPGDEDFKLVLPLLTTKRVFLRAVVAELLWFLSGNTSATALADQNVHIWDGNGSREFLDNLGLSHRAEGDLGPVYGFQWRHFGAEYKDATSDYKGQGVDQLAEIVRKLKSSPFDRRIILSAWNPADLGKMALPPCHMFAQFYVSFPSKKRRSPESKSADPTAEKGVLHTILYQRSCDMGLGIPFNIASYALLTHMLAHACDLVPGSLTHTMGDAHVYLDHIEALEIQLNREPRDFPTLELPEAKRAGGLEALESWKAEDFVIKDYNPHKAVPMKMSV